MSKARLYCNNETKMYIELDKFGAYPETTNFEYKGVIYQITDNEPEQDFIKCFKVGTSDDIKIFKKNELFDINPAEIEIFETCKYTSEILEDLFKYENSYYHILKFNKKIAKKFNLNDKMNYFKILIDNL